MQQMWTLKMGIDIGIGVLLLFLAIEDGKSRRVRCWMLAAGCLLAAIGLCGCKNRDILDIVGGVGIGFFLLLIGKATRGIGSGDAVVFIFLGMWMGWFQGFCVLAAAVFIAGIAAAGLKVIKKVGWKYRIPFLPFVFMAYVGVMALW